ncbi:MFS transporter [Synechococcus sp. KORDI-100]|uniref:MFS transporter n=1 Tax=Synechococcus sp. KORDI-100 TaxID=1280380 RepID=UPI001EF4AB58|nr:MFS transporter [Synechococcus sp. KORDI-100]
MTPMVFHAIDFSASQVGSGLALSALVGTVVRLLSGALLDRGLSCSWPIRFTTILAVLADITLFRADSYGGFVAGEILLGSAAGLYWPAIELAVPLSCGAVPSGRGYALVRSSDALGFGIGALIGSLCAWLGTLRLIYGVEAICMIAVLVLISLNPLLDERSSTAEARQRQTPEPRLKPTWLLPLLPVLAISIMATGILSLEQSALPIDLVRGGLERPGLSETSSGGLIALQLSLLVILQWPVGRWLAERSVGFGLGLSLSSFSLACLLLGVSALTSSGTTLVVLALLPMALAQAAFLPTATEAVIEETPPQHRGFAMALFSQCFAISAVVAPLLGGALLDQQGHGLLLWLGMAVACLAMLPTAYQLRPRFDSSGSREHLVDAVAGNPGPLGG